MHQPQDDRYALILAGGDSLRLDSITRTTAGAARPKQFCDLFGGGTLLEHTLHRIACVVPPERTSTLVSRRHEPFFCKLASQPGSLLVQSENRGTAPAVLYGALSVQRRNPNAIIAIFPSDHYFRNEIAFMMQVRSAFRLVERRPDLIVLLGIVPDHPATDYGWIEPGDPVPGTREDTVLRIHRFWQRPAPQQAESLLAHGCLWNCKVVVGSADALLTLMRDGAPSLYRAFEPAHPMLGTLEEDDAVQHVYANLLAMDFYSEVLERSTQVLAVLPVAESGWVEIADPVRTLALVEATHHRIGSAGG